jgi:protoporphyrinogen oxidase
MSQEKTKVAVIGAGFSGLAAAYELVRRGYAPVLIEADAEVGGLASGFHSGGTRFERFYHHWYTSDRYVEELAGELGVGDRITRSTTRMGMYFANRIYSLSRPLDLLRLTLLPFVDRLRLGWLALNARRVANWRELDHQTAAEWLRRHGGERAYRIIWEPLLRGKFGRHAEEVSAAWIWAKLRLRGGSRSRKGEHLAYFQGGFAALADEILKRIVEGGGEIRLGSPASRLVLKDGRVAAVVAGNETIPVAAAIFTPAPSLTADILSEHLAPEVHRRLAAIEYLANICIVLELTRSLSELYWMNVNDPSFPFVGIIEHTQLDQADPAGRRHIVYLSRYLPADDPALSWPDSEVVAFALPYLHRMFPDFHDDLVSASHVWRARYAQPLVVRGYGDRIPDHRTPIPGAYIASMAQVYPEDRGTNYAIRDGRRVAQMVDAWLERR